MPQAWYLVSRPTGAPELSNFELRSLPSAELENGMVRVRNSWISVDPYMRPRMDDVESYVPPFRLGEPLTGAAVGLVIESRSPDFAPGDRVSHPLGWRDEAAGPAGLFQHLPVDGRPDSDHLNALGMVGATAYFGLFDVAAAKRGETVFVSAAAGAVGSLVVQMAKARGLRVVASAGGARKCDYVLSLGADRAIDYKASGRLIEKLADAAPEGIDAYFDNVGGEHLDAALGRARIGARFAICGMIDMYNEKAPVRLSNLFRIIASRIQIRGFLVGDFAARFPEFHAEMAEWLKRGLIVPRETVFEGLAETPTAFLSLFNGGNTGKALVKIGGGA